MGIFNEVVDITHHSKRTQAGNLAAAGVATTATSPSTNNYNTSNVPQNITVERAIQYFRDNATGEYANLYTATAQWLERYLTYSKSLVDRAVEESAKEVPTVDISEVSDSE